jgi:hypothetical protein
MYLPLEIDKLKERGRVDLKDKEIYSFYKNGKSIFSDQECGMFQLYRMPEPTRRRKKNCSFKIHFLYLNLIRILGRTIYLDEQITKWKISPKDYNYLKKIKIMPGDRFIVKRTVFKNVTGYYTTGLSFFPVSAKSDKKVDSVNNSYKKIFNKIVGDKNEI